jgi:7-cyano-7-deazaguanine synthase
LIEQACSAALDFKFRIHAPFLTLSKREVMKLGRNLPLELTFSCLSPQKQKGTVPQKGDSPLLLHCGRCNKCAERKRAFRDSGIKDRTQYAR